MIQFSPPCSLCNQNTTFSFKIQNLVNPSFISEETTQIHIQTLTDFGGIVELFDGDILLKEKNLVINNYSWTGNSSIVGSEFKMTISYEIPTYIQKNGGYLKLNFDANVVFMNALMNSNIVSFPSSLNVLNANNNALQNNIEYYSNSSI